MYDEILEVNAYVVVLVNVDTIYLKMKNFDFEFSLFFVKYILSETVTL